MKRKYIFIFILIFSTSMLKAQRFGNIHFYDKWNVNANIGVAMLWGDIEENWNGHLRFLPAIEIGIGKELNTFFSIENNFVAGNLEGYNSSYNRYFKADFFEYNFSGILDLSIISSGFNVQRMIHIDGILGIGFYNYNSILKTISTDSILNTIAYDINNNNAGRKTELILKTGFKVKFRISDQVDLNLNNTWSFTGSDYLDAYKGGFAYDIYSFTSIGITYKFNLRKNGKSMINYGKR